MKASRDALYENPNTKHRKRLMATFERNCDTAQLLCRTEKGYVSIQVGPGYSARFTHKTAEGIRSVNLSNARDCCAFVTSDLHLKGDDIERKVVTSYVTKTTREDVLKIRGKKVTRTTKWEYPGKREAIATYSEAGRDLRWFESGKPFAQVVTTAKQTPVGWHSSNRVMDAPVVPTPPTSNTSITTLGNSVVEVVTKTAGGDTSSSISITGVGEGGAISMVVGSVEHVRPHLDEHRVVTSISSINPAKDSEGFVQNVISNQGGTTVTTRQTGQHADGSSESSHGLAQAAGDGSFSTLTTYEKDGQLVQRSAYSNDGQGNESETTVTYDKDGSFTIETITTDKNGNKSGDAQKYDKDGNPVGSSGVGSSGAGSTAGSGSTGGSTTPSSGGDDDDGGGDDDNSGDEDDGSGDDEGGGDEGGGDDGGGDDGGMPSDDESGSSKRRPGKNGPLGEFPSDDGSDPTPTPYSTDPGNGSLENWLEGLSPFFGGFGSRFGGSHINPATQIADSIDGGDGGERSPSRQGSGASPAFDLTPMIRRENDPENNPRALINALAKLAGLSVNSSGMKAAGKLADYIAG